MGKGTRLARRVPPSRTQLPQRPSAPRRWAVSGIAAILFVIAGMVAVRMIGGPPNHPSPAQPAGPMAAAVLDMLSRLPSTTFDSVGVGKVDGLPKRLPGQPALTEGGKPLVVYIGAEYCPFCAAQRWPLVVALLRFGSFTGLATTHSASADVYPNTATVSFHGATYASQWLVFQGVETNGNTRQGNGYAPLDRLTDTQTRILSTYDAAPYVPAASAGAIPFLDLGNLYLVSGSSYSPQLLEGKSAEQIATALTNPSDPIAQSILGAANALTSVLCQLTGNQPANVCTSPAVIAYQDKLHG